MPTDAGRLQRRRQSFSDRDKQILWETLVVPALYVLAQDQNAISRKDAPALKTCLTIAGEGLTKLFAVTPERVVLSEADAPLSILPEIKTAATDTGGNLHVKGKIAH